MLKRNICIGTALAGVVLAGAILAAACSSKETPDKIDLSSIHTTAAETMAPYTSSPAASEEVTLESPGETARETSEVKNISFEMTVYTDEGISIQYPQISDMTDPDMQEKINVLLKEHALSILKAWDFHAGECTVEIQCQVPSITRKRITAVYTGCASRKDSAHPTNLFFTNTMDLNSGKELGFSDFSDPYTMAGYVLSNDVQFDGLDAAQTDAVIRELRNMDIDYYTDIFSKADFPLDTSGTWPSSFSYEKEGVICFSVPVSHALGDYAVVKFTPETK